MTNKKDRMLDFWMEMRLHGVEPDAVVRASDALCLDYVDWLGSRWA